VISTRAMARLPHMLRFMTSAPVSDDPSADGITIIVLGEQPDK
jgi:hypothetical protein